MRGAVKKILENLPTNFDYNKLSPSLKRKVDMSIPLNDTEHFEINNDCFSIRVYKFSEEHPDQWFYKMMTMDGTSGHTGVVEAKDAEAAKNLVLERLTEWAEYHREFAGKLLECLREI